MEIESHIAQAGVQAIAKDGLEPPASVSQVLELQVCGIRLWVMPNDAGQVPLQCSRALGWQG